ncbi:MAG TPA: hypothetical protein VMZ69_00365, partial [Saprospiraceae bacterium]|nr:hypothetical protein [Saprospiraceae bacterium]
MRDFYKPEGPAISNFQRRTIRALIYGALIVVGNLIFSNSAWAATYTLTTGGAANAQTPGNWNTGGVGGGGAAATNFTTNGDIFIIASGTAGTFVTNTTSTFGSGVTLQVDGTFTIGSTSNNSTLVSINGT